MIRTFGKAVKQKLQTKTKTQRLGYNANAVAEIFSGQLMVVATSMLCVDYCDRNEVV